MCLYKKFLGYGISILTLFGPTIELKDNINFIMGNDSNNERPLQKRNEIMNNIEYQDYMIYLIELDTSILV